MAFWTSDDPFDPSLSLPSDQAANTGWGFDALDGSGQDWDNWLAGLESLPQHPERRHEQSTEAHHSYPLNRSPSPVHGGYASWLTGNTSSSTRDEAARPPLRPVATSSSASRPTNPPTSATSRRPDFPRQAEPSNTAPRNFTAAPNHSTNWLDPTEARRPARQPYIPQPFATLDPISPSATSPSDTDTDHGIDIDEVLTEDDVAAMPATTRHTQRGPPRSSVVDLTNDPSSPPRPSTSTTRKRSRDDSAQDRRSAKRSRRASNNASPRQQPTVEELDLTNEAPSAEEELLQNQQQAAIAAQQSATAAADPDRPLRVGQRTCIICMEPYTNATVTACGHIYCHECLTQALIAGEKNSERGLGNCPVCRKPVSRKKDRQMVPVSFMKREAWRGKRPARGVGVGG